uniref:SCP domain-containing protein n=1 Tax=Strongyloides papillosus TaxID=174720 RepID=A0A0N5BQI2_STREA
MGFKRGREFIKTEVKTAESILPFIDSRYQSSTFDLKEYELTHNGVYYCGKTVNKNLELVFQVAKVSKCHIKINAPSTRPMQKPCVVKPITPPKSFCISTAHGCMHYKYNKAFHYIWNEIWSTCSKNLRKGFTKMMKAKATEINRYRRFCGKTNLFIHKKLSDLAQRCANSMMSYQKSRKDITQRLTSNLHTQYGELRAYVSRGQSMLLMYILFGDAWTHNSNFDRPSERKWEMAQLMDKKTKYAGIGMSSSQNDVFVCITFSQISPYTE